ncbi:hypothetical protein SAMN03159341_13034 [Paenibacillus sp. 1_12]|nr:hypothetical protein SAMN03159341_13034 [Paenibacillus sp. 1_12]
MMLWVLDASQRRNRIEGNTNTILTTVPVGVQAEGVGVNL